MELKNIKVVKDYKGNESATMIINDVELNWAFLAEPSEMSGKYEVTIPINYEIEEEYKKVCEDIWSKYKAVKKLKSEPQTMGYSDLKDVDGNPTGALKIVAKSIHTTQEGKVLPPPIVLDSAKQPIDLKNYPTIGNGTVADIKIQVQPYEFKKQHGLSVKLKAVRIKKLVEYTGSNVDVDEFDDFEDDL